MRICAYIFVPCFLYMSPIFIFCPYFLSTFIFCPYLHKLRRLYQISLTYKVKNILVSRENAVDGKLPCYRDN